jgi:hypothetical protein
MQDVETVHGEVEVISRNFDAMVGAVTRQITPKVIAELPIMPDQIPGAVWSL